MVLMDGRDLVVSLAVAVRTAYLVEEDLPVDQALPAAKACLEIPVYLVVPAG